MAAGDVYNGLSAAVANGGFVDLQPAGAAEAVVTNIFVEGSFELHWYDGANTIIFLTDSASSGAILNCSFHVTNGKWLRIKNTAGAAKDIGWDGVYTK